MIRYFLEWLISQCFANGPEIITRKPVEKLVVLLANLFSVLISVAGVCLIYRQIDIEYFHRYSSFWEILISSFSSDKLTKDERITFYLLLVMPVSIFIGFEAWMYHSLQTKKRRKVFREMREKEVADYIKNGGERKNLK